MLEIKQVPLNQISELISPSLAEKLKLPNWIAVEARLEGQLAGFLLAECEPALQAAEIELFTVKEAFRAQGIGEALLAYAQNLLHTQEKVTRIAYQFEKDASFPALEKILAKLGWTTPQMVLIRFFFDAQGFNPPWIHLPLKLPPNMAFFPWKELKAEDRARIEYLVYQGRCPPFLSPLVKEQEIHLDTSFGLRKEGKIIGWNVTKKLGPSSLLYWKLFIDTPMAAGSFGIQLLLKSIHRQKELPIQDALFEINLEKADPSWWRFIKKRGMPYATKIERLWRTMRFF